MVQIKSRREINLTRKTCKLAAETLNYAKTLVVSGISTDEINTKVHDYIIKHGAYPSPLNYKGFPKSICTSVNDVVCHGIPNENEILKDGDIINIDITTYLNGFHGDTSATFFVGENTKATKDFVNIAENALKKGIEMVYPGNNINTIGYSIEKYIMPYNYSIVHEYCGHGIGREFHEEPQILHFYNRYHSLIMQSGMIFTIEPIINIGFSDTFVCPNKWTVKTTDGLLSAQFEHTILVTDNGYEILTIA